MIDNLGAYIGLGIVTIGIAIIWFLADKDGSKHKRKTHHKFHPHSKHKPKHS